MGNLWLSQNRGRLSSAVKAALSEIRFMRDAFECLQGTHLTDKIQENRRQLLNLSGFPAS